MALESRPQVTARLTLSPRVWYGLQLLGPLARNERDNETWTAATPIFVSAVAPLKTGSGLVELEFVRAIAAVRPAVTTLKLKVVHRDDGILLATGEGWRDADVTGPHRVVQLDC